VYKYRETFVLMPPLCSITEPRIIASDAKEYRKWLAAFVIPTDPPTLAAVPSYPCHNAENLQKRSQLFV